MRTIRANKALRLNEDRALAAALMLTVVLAPQPAARANTSDLDEIYVSAQRIARPLQTTPASITVLSGDELRQRDIVSVHQLTAVAPNLNWVATDRSPIGSVFIRGVGSPSIHTNQLGAVGLFADDITLNAPLLANFALMDLERIEVVRGPWNAGFGRNASGGAVRFVSRSPHVGESARADVLLRVGSAERLDVELAGDLPTSDRSAARIAFAYQSLGDFVDNVTLGREEGEHARTTARLKWRYEAGANTRVDVGANGMRYRGDAVRYKQIGRGTPGNPGRSDCPLLDYDREPGNGCVDQSGFADTPGYERNFSGHPNELAEDIAGAFLRFEQEFAGLQFVSLTAYVAGDSTRQEDGDGGPAFFHVANQETDSSQWSQDLRIGSTGDSADGWQVGAYFLDEDARYTSTRRNPNPLLSDALVPGVDIPESGTPSLMLFGDLSQRVRSFALWAQADHELTTRTRLGAELRVAREELYGTMRSGAYADVAAAYPPALFVGTDRLQEIQAASVAVGNGAPLPVQCPRPFVLTRCYTSADFDRADTLWGGRIVVEHRFDDALFGYASVARGFKGAGISPIGRDAIVGLAGNTVSPERVTSYEIGMKSEWLNDTLQANASVFYNDWTDYQLYLSVASSQTILIAVLANLPEASTWGGELELAWAPTPSWRISAALGVTRSEVRDQGNNVDVVPGSPLIGTPELTFNAVGARTWQLAGGQFTAQIESSYADERPFSLTGDPVLVDPAYWLFDASARYRWGPLGQYELALSGRNLTASQYCLQRFLLGGLGNGDVYTCQPNEGERFFAVSLTATIQ